MSITTTNARTIRTAVASLTLMAAAITLTACNNDDADGVKRSGSAESSAAAQGSDSKGGSGDSGAKAKTCDPGKVSMSVSKVSRPVNHLLLKATNNSGTTCNLPGYPLLRFDEAQAATPAAEATKPQAVVTLAPGKSGYAGILTSSADGSGSEGTKVAKLGVSLQGSDAATTVSLPGGSVYIDSSAQVTYWQSVNADALDW
ncbi:DUF4232 domain-containing protein [Streptomyces sp. NPDC048636]|uniref:DUF4232 domain-containing protein n=1 Tax=Streptomyces sp. NPDC048636 TaxID=3155762 RepID=UPI00344154A7